MADGSVAEQQRTAYERDSVPDDEYRAAVLALLGFHAVPVWGWGQRAAYEKFAMEGPSLDHWVRTTGLWAEAERDLWEWEQMVAAITVESFDDVVEHAVGRLARDTVTALEQWLDMVFLPICIDGLGEELVRTMAASTYGPLVRHARRMVMYKRGQCADGCSSLDEIVANTQFDTALLRDRAEFWLGVAGEYARQATVLEAASGWVERAIADPLDVDGALERVGARLHAHLEEKA